MTTHTLEVRPNEVAGWDILHQDDPDAITNVATKDEALKAAEVLAEEEGGSEVVVREEPHELSDTGRGVKLYVFAILTLLAIAIVIIAFTGWLSSALDI